MSRKSGGGFSETGLWNELLASLASRRTTFNSVFRSAFYIEKPSRSNLDSWKQGKKKMIELDDKGVECLLPQDRKSKELLVVDVLVFLSIRLISDGLWTAERLKEIEETDVSSDRFLQDVHAYAKYSGVPRASSALQLLAPISNSDSFLKRPIPIGLVHLCESLPKHHAEYLMSLWTAFRKPEFSESASVALRLEINNLLISPNSGIRTASFTVLELLVDENVKES